LIVPGRSAIGARGETFAKQFEVRGLDDAAFGRGGPVLQGAPAMSVADLAGDLLCGHLDEHLGSIKATVGR
jgi:hypothetical protein